MFLAVTIFRTVIISNLAYSVLYLNGMTQGTMFNGTLLIIVTNLYWIILWNIKIAGGCPPPCQALIQAVVIGKRNQRAEVWHCCYLYFNICGVNLRKKNIQFLSVISAYMSPDRMGICHYMTEFLKAYWVRNGSPFSAWARPPNTRVSHVVVRSDLTRSAAALTWMLYTVCAKVCKGPFWCCVMRTH